VVLAVDNHGSRYDDEVLAAFGHAESEYGIRIFTEEPNTSQFLQALDQYNKKFHDSYQKTLHAYRMAYQQRHGKPPSMGLVDFFSILSGSGELNIPGMWFIWCDSIDVINAWRKVGICGNVLAPEGICRDGFIDQHDPTVSRVTSANAGPSTASAPAADSPPPSPTAGPIGSPTFSEYVCTPEGVASGSNEALLGKLARARELDAHNRSKPPKFRKIFDPSAEGLLPIPERVVRQPADAEHTRLDSHFGSMSLHNIAQQKAERRDAQAAV